MDDFSRQAYHVEIYTNHINLLCPHGIDCLSQIKNNNKKKIYSFVLLIFWIAPILANKLKLNYMSIVHLLVELIDW